MQQQLSIQTIDLSRLAGERIKVDFSSALQDVVLNIADQQYNWKTKRKIVIKVTFEPQTRNDVVVSVECSAVLAKRCAQKTSVTIGRRNGQVSASEPQLSIPDFDIGDLGYDHINALVGLDSIGNGSALERFDVEMQRVIKNILDPNMPLYDKRSITLTFQFMPTQERVQAVVKYGCVTKLCPEEPITTFLSFVGEGDAIGVRESLGSL